ncbi:LysM peptidoglycan-binding domain-containing protein [Methanolobus sp. ZRKC3]|uniref:CIS tube protein n=1 Tax=Methanolobus sp. ZRKC3 TaxID=3125786 RepID=UPI00324E1146
MVRKLEKAFIRALKKKLNLHKAFIEVLDGEQKGERIEILYFPPEYTMEKSNSFSEIAIPGLESPYVQYVKGNAGSITLEAFYDTYEDGTDVREYTNKLSNLMNIDPDLHAPPPLRFIWGMPSKEPFTCVLEKVTNKFIMFLSDGTPVRAKLSITLKEFKTRLNSRESARKSSDKTKVYITKQGDSLWLIAHKEYGNSSMWRPIADKNNIYNPRFLEPGTRLIIPPLE